MADAKVQPVSKRQACVPQDIGLETLGLDEPTGLNKTNQLYWSKPN